MRTVSLLSVVVVGVLFSPQAFVQNAPGTPMSAEEIIKQLAPPDPAATPAPAQGTEGRTRSLRNLKPVARSIDMSIKSIGTIFTDNSKRFVDVQLVAQNAKDVSKVVLLDGEERFRLKSF